MDLRQLEMFRSVAKEGTFSRAAERLRVSRSAVSRQVKLLEEELGGRLLHRGAVADLRHTGAASRGACSRSFGSSSRRWICG